MAASQHIPGQDKSQEGTSVPYGVKFINPENIISRLDIREGMKVADFGCGTGYFAIPLAKKVGKSGIVYAFDIIEQKLESVTGQARLNGLRNIVTNKVNLEKERGSGLDDSSVDWTVLVNMLFQNDDKEQIIREAKWVLKPDGSILVIEWNPHDSSVGPKDDLKIPKEMIIEIARKNMMAIAVELEVGSFNYGLVLAK